MTDQTAAANAFASSLGVLGIEAVCDAAVNRLPGVIRLYRITDTITGVALVPAMDSIRATEDGAGVTVEANLFLRVVPDDGHPTTIESIRVIATGTFGDPGCVLEGIDVHAPVTTPVSRVAFNDY